MKRSAGKSSSALSLLTRNATRISGHLVGQLVPGEAGATLVTFPNNPHGPLRARSVVDLPSSGSGQAVLLVFEEERSELPIIVGVLREPGAPPLEDKAVGELREAQVDGKRVVLSGEDEIVLRCGKASITLRRNGRVVIRGAYVETRAEGVNRVKGGSVQIN